MHVSLRFCGWLFVRRSVLRLDRFFPYLFYWFFVVILIASDGDYDKLVLLEGVDEKVSIDFSNVNIDDWLCGRTIWLLS